MSLMAKTNPFVPLDAAYYDNPKIIDAGEKAEVLYVRCLGKAKLLLSDGELKKAHVVRMGLSGTDTRIKSLLRVGLWEETPGGYQIVGWLDRNMLASEVVADMETKRDAGILGNHVRWHAEKTDRKCPHCRKAIAGAIASANGHATTVRIPKTEIETEIEIEV